MIDKFRYIFQRKDKWKLVGMVIMMIVGSGLELSAVAIFNPFIELLMNSEQVEENTFLLFLFNNFHFNSLEKYLVIIALGIGLVYLVKNVYLGFLQNIILSFSYTTRMNLATRLLSTYMREPYVFHLSKNIAEMQRSLQTDTSQFMLLVNSILQLTVEVAVSIVLGLYLFHTSHSITVIIIGLLLICIGFFYLVSKRISFRLGKQNEYYNAKLFQWINQSLGGIKEVKILQREDYFINSYKVNYKKLIKGAKLNELLAALPKYIVETVCMTGLLLAIVVKLLYGHGDLSTFIPQLTTFAVASFRLLPSVGKINAYVNSIMYSRASLDMIYEDLKEIEQYTPMQSYNRVSAKDLAFQRGIFVDKISYHYPDADVIVLNNVSLEIPKGKTIALIGPSGAGKTTLADIILGLLEPVSGYVKMDDNNIYDNLSLWHTKLGYIPQSIYLSDDSVRNNIAFGISKEEIDDSAIWEALEKAQLKQFVENLPDGLETYVGDRGVRLSGGQRQRIGIARALYHDPEILVLDEATSALDNDTENAVMGAIESLQGTKTMIIIAHRLSTIKNADYVYEVVNGEVIMKNKDEIINK
ncbi:ABC transporter ATP-binding protein [Eisenbergiella tayi]|uniref:Heterocyst differentiation ATP-binding protein HepA n=1 Tax=Eisenbergiella tayi TaxID=1432052 RepID=A0A1E3ABR5_9FIRM|nr:ABC transporter ATP-binding protein [Eisenbergiella tayi]ODM05616.1 Heterocyst differentiation ATP-binding protein HepA [Eisenbergiella tayi]